VDKAKVDLISNLPPPRTVKEALFIFDEDCKKAFGALKAILTSTPIIWPPNWGTPFEIMCDASDYAVGAVLGKRIDKLPHVIYYASRTLNDAQLNYSTTEKELLAFVFALDKFRSYLLGSKVIIYSDHIDCTTIDHIDRTTINQRSYHIRSHRSYHDRSHRSYHDRSHDRIMFDHIDCTTIDHIDRTTINQRSYHVRSHRSYHDRSHDRIMFDHIDRITFNHIDRTMIDHIDRTMTDHMIVPRSIS